MTPTPEALRDHGYFSWLDVRFAKTMARLSKTEDPLAILGAAVASRYAMHGHVCADLRALGGTKIRMPEGETIGELSWPDLEPWLETLRKIPMVGSLASGDPVSPLVLDAAGRLYLTRYWLYEKRLAGQIVERSIRPAQGVNPALLDEGLERLFSTRPDAPDAAQREAARVAVTRKMAVISGGPGTGKTSTVVKILALLFEQAAAKNGGFPSVSMVAPTGKAAVRLDESVAYALDQKGGVVIDCEERIRDLIREVTAGTIHRTLGTNPRTPTSFRHGADNPLSADVVIVDEASMVDLPLMTKLFDAVRSEASLILLGDRDQLVSVEVGAVLGDICNTGGADPEKHPDGPGIWDCITNLTHSFRFSAEEGIGRLARAINEGNADAAIDCLESDKWPDVRLIEMGAAKTVPDKIEPLIRDHYGAYLDEEDPQKRLEAQGTFRILCAHRRGPTGVGTINPLVERVLGHRLDRRRDRLWYEGRPIIITRNDYQLDLFNGDVGVIGRDGEHSGSLRAFFPGKKTSYLPARLPPHETVFAMTAHKSQGSEYDHVLILLPEERSPIVTRELLYTAVTRSRKSVTLCARKDVVREAVCAPVRRSSGLREELWGVG
jgi:exodeoxyribonuclease V alpha subunit